MFTNHFISDKTYTLLVQCFDDQ